MTKKIEFEFTEEVVVYLVKNNYLLLTELDELIISNNEKYDLINIEETWKKLIENKIVKEEQEGNFVLDENGRSFYRLMDFYKAKGKLGELEHNISKLKKSNDTLKDNIDSLKLEARNQPKLNVFLIVIICLLLAYILLK